MYVSVCVSECSVYTRHLKTCVWGGVAVTLVTLLLYAPTPATLSYTPTHPLSGDSGAGEMAEGEGGETPLALLALTCTPTTHLLFLKTHKCASTTVQNILFRFGYSRNLTFALPDAGNYLGNPSFFQAKMLPRRLVPIGGKVDIFAVHSRLNFLEHARVLHGDAKWLTVVREPAALYESLYNFYNMHNTYGFGLDKFGKKSMRELASLPRFGSKLGRNQMLFDLGYSENLTVSDLRRAMDDLDHTFNQVLIAEKMDESLILLRHLLFLHFKHTAWLCAYKKTHKHTACLSAYKKTHKHTAWLCAYKKTHKHTAWLCLQDHAQTHCLSLCLQDHAQTHCLALCLQDNAQTHAWLCAYKTTHKHTACLCAYKTTHKHTACLCAYKTTHKHTACLSAYKTTHKHTAWLSAYKTTHKHTACLSAYTTTHKHTAWLSAYKTTHKHTACLSVLTRPRTNTLPGSLLTRQRTNTLPGSLLTRQRTNTLPGSLCLQDNAQTHCLSLLTRQRTNTNMQEPGLLT
ncbi:Galactosylceramide sulfotransferase [Chionoecetes opilio]|uniref:Galactosylceramide sulfotransferase n=1 Tax=Chionoecetes opilio TaxID=41210 RepID=A0A8J8WLK1_CHIOP|nr:Galactosylceramide sulfotransferase [Chionoecetes opilio]